MVKRDWLKDLRIQENKDGAKITKINGTNIKKINFRITQLMNCEGICICGKPIDKKIRHAVKNGCFCKDCMVLITVKRRKQAKLERHGNENFNNSEKMKATAAKKTPQEWDIITGKVKATKLERYDDENYCNADKVKETVAKRTPEEWVTILEKQKATKLERHGNENFNNSEKMKATKLERYDDENYVNSEKQKATVAKRNQEEWDIIIEKQKATKLERYDDENYNNRDKVKVTCLKRYGQENAMHVPEIAKKAAQHYKKDYTFKTGENIKCDGAEPLALKILEYYFDYTYNDYNDEKFKNLKIMYIINKKTHRYYPDIPFLRNNKIIEVKSYYTLYNYHFEKNIKKAECVINKGYDFEWWIFDDKNELTIINTNFIENKFLINKHISLMNK
jgi:hypothetical protein